ncbi:hypothetical protein BHM03_00023332 [Ensete ventricosum]|nr:hypothetical protein BHM03_00023332 [Ensete ventricosum]
MWIQTRHDVAPARTSGRCLPPRVSAPIICVHVIRYDTERERERRGSDIVTRGGHVSRPLSVSLDRGDVAVVTPVDDPGHDCLGALSTGKRSTSIVLCEACSGFDRRI